MGGKSTFLRQNALIAILAQMGSFVPADSAHIGVIDRVFSRVGASDDIAHGRSTFMVEMVETAAILNRATANSLVILDEIGRGTATFDGLSIAWAAVEALHNDTGCRGLFATHFHEMTALAKTLARVSNVTMAVREWEGEVVFLHEVVPGAADRSYGIQVARLAGLPETVLARARQVLGVLEQRSSGQSAPVLDDLPLFAAARRRQRSRKLILSMPCSMQVRPDDLSPAQALESDLRVEEGPRCRSPKLNSARKKAQFHLNTADDHPRRGGDGAWARIRPNPPPAALGRARRSCARRWQRRARSAEAELMATGKRHRAAPSNLSAAEDEIIRAVHHVRRHATSIRSTIPPAPKPISLAAVGGYGRGTLAPGSDIDLLFILPYKQTPWGEQVTEYILYMLWDLGQKVGHAVRSVDDCIRMARADMTVRTATLEARFLTGDKHAVRSAADSASKPRSCPRPGPNSSPPRWPSATSATARWAIPAMSSSPTSRTARAACATSTRCSGSASTSTRSRPAPSWSTRACSAPTNTACSSAPRISSGPSAATCTSSPAAPTKS